jgi:hypothetical protein
MGSEMERQDATPWEAGFADDPTAGNRRAKTQARIVSTTSLVC